MKLIFLFAFLILLTTHGLSQENVSGKKFEEITLVNKIDFYNPKFDQTRFSCGFLLKYKNDTFAVTAKHLLKIIRSDEMKAVTFENGIRNWTLYPLTKKEEVVITDKLLNENSSESLEAKSTYDDDWLVFSIKENRSKVRPLEIRTAPLVDGEKLYVAGWTRKMETGGQRVYEFEYYKTIDNRILLKDLIVPEQFGGLSGAPLLDEHGLVAGIVSNATVDKQTNKRYFSPCNLVSLMSFLDKLPPGK